MHAVGPTQHEIAHSTRAGAPDPAPNAAQLAILVQTAREDGRAVNAAGGGAAAEDAGAAKGGEEESQPDAELDEEWTSEQLSNAALLVSSVLAAHAAVQPAVRLGSGNLNLNLNQRRWAAGGALAGAFSLLTAPFFIKLSHFFAALELTTSKLSFGFFVSTYPIPEESQCRKLFHGLLGVDTSVHTV